MRYVFLTALISFNAYAAEIVQTSVGPRATGYLGLGKNPRYSTIPMDTTNLPETWDWRFSSGVSSIKNQGGCGSCWSFAITKSLESALIVQNSDNEMDLSEQQMVSCVKTAYGCNGGFMDSADYVVKQGLTDEKTFPYTASNGRCKSVAIKAKAAKYALLGSSNRKPTIDEIKAAIVTYGPVFVTVAAGGNGWSGKTGEVTGCRNTGTNHMVNLVGWTKSGKWILANSWGKSWANKGYSLIKFGCDKIGEEAGYIVVE